MAADPHLMLPGGAARRGRPFVFLGLAHSSGHSNNLSIIKNAFDILNKRRKSLFFAKNGLIPQTAVFSFQGLR